MSWGGGVVYLGREGGPLTVEIVDCDGSTHSVLQSKLLHTRDFASLNTTTFLLARMKELAVVKVQKSVHFMNLYKMVQQTEENIRAFSAQL